jgi:hypothetical protein
VPIVGEEVTGDTVDDKSNKSKEEIPVPLEFNLEYIEVYSIL